MSDILTRTNPTYKVLLGTHLAPTLYRFYIFLKTFSLKRENNVLALMVGTT